MIEYKRDLNPAQYEAVSTLEGPVLVVAGAGSGKTRTIVYRLARLIEEGVPASSILLLTFTRKAAQEMLERARQLMPNQNAHSPQEFSARGIHAIQGGTFHSYAYSVLRQFRPEGFGTNLTVMDSHDILAALQHCRNELQAGKGDRSFPQKNTISGLLSKSRNKEVPLEEVLRRDAPHLLTHAESLEQMAESYARYKREKSLLDYDDLLFTLEEVLISRPDALAHCRARHRYIMVDEYQDTNAVQARIAALVAGIDPERLKTPILPHIPESGGWAHPDGQGEKSPSHAPGDNKNTSSHSPFSGNIMVVGDDAQSIYAFRGADVRNILQFPALFPGTRIIRLEENYRSSQPLLDFSNAVLKNASEGYEKHLFSTRKAGMKPTIVHPLSDRSQALLVAARIAELIRIYPPGSIAVLFRSGFHSYALEVVLNKMGLPFRKYGGIRYVEAAHVKDVMAFVRLVLNPLDFTAFSRVAGLSKGVGEKTCLKLYRLALAGDALALAKGLSRYRNLTEDMAFIDACRQGQQQPASLLARVIEYYHPRLESLYPDDYPKRQQGLEQLIQIASAYSDLDLLVADLSLEDPIREEGKSDFVVLSTIHSAKGLEWSAVLLLDLVEERFPSRHSMIRPEEFEEERRLLYVACTRAREFLELYVPAGMYDRNSGGMLPTAPSPFVRELSPDLYGEVQEGYTGGLVARKNSDLAHPLGDKKTTRLQKNNASAASDTDAHGVSKKNTHGIFGHGDAPAVPPSQCGYCRHKIFGRGKIVQHLPPDRYRVHFPGLGLKVIMGAYLGMEE